MTSTTTTVPEGTVTDAGKQGLGGRPASGEPAESAAKAVNAPKGEGKYAARTEELCARILEASKAAGRANFAEWVSATYGRKITPSAVWRAERNKLSVDESVFWATVDLAAAPKREVKSKAGKMDAIVALLDQAAEDKSYTKAKLIEELRKLAG
jgi:hypothetical protein